MTKTLRSGYENDTDDVDAYAYALCCRSCGTVGGWSKSETGAVRCWHMRPGEKDPDLEAIIERNRLRKLAGRNDDATADIDLLTLWLANWRGRALGCEHCIEKEWKPRLAQLQQQLESEPHA